MTADQIADVRRTVLVAADRERKMTAVEIIIISEMTAVAAMAGAIAENGYLSVLRRHRADSTGLSRSRKIPARETAKRMIETNKRRVVTERVRRRK